VVGVLGGAVTSATLYAVRLAKVRSHLAPDLGAGHVDFKSLRRVLRLAGPLVAGGLVGQMSGAIVARSLSRLAAGSLAAFGYSWKLGQIVLLTPGALSTVLFPRLSDTFHSRSPEEFSESYVRALRALFFVTIPMTFLAYSLREPIVRLLLQRGAFSLSAAQLTAALFGLLILGAPGGAAVTYLERIFYATQETTLPVIVSISCTVIAMALVPSLAVSFGVAGIASIYMLLPWLNSAVLLVLFQHKHGGFPFGRVALFVFQTTAIAGVSAWFGVKSGRWLASLIAGGILSVFLWLAGSTLITGALYIGATLGLGLPEAATCRNHLRRLLHRVCWPSQGYVNT
jgi:putative peptidoglycan lipid II flippase